MDAQLFLTIQDASNFAKNSCLTFSDYMFHPIKSSKFGVAKAEILVSLDNGQPWSLKAAKDPYLLNIAPGHHTLTVDDPYRQKKQAKQRTNGFLTGLLFGAVTDSSMSFYADDGANIANMIFNDVAGVIEFDAREGDTYKLKLKPTVSGKVKIKVLK
jgi:hypothetical protein